MVEDAQVFPPGRVLRWVCLRVDASGGWCRRVSGHLCTISISISTICTLRHLGRVLFNTGGSLPHLCPVFLAHPQPSTHLGPVALAHHHTLAFKQHPRKSSLTPVIRFALFLLPPCLDRLRPCRSPDQPSSHRQPDTEGPVNLLSVSSPACQEFFSQLNLSTALSTAQKRGPQPARNLCANRKLPPGRQTGSEQTITTPNSRYQQSLVFVPV